MEWIRRSIARLARRLGMVTGRSGAEGAMDEEMRFHLEMEARELEAAGHSPEEARRLARVRFGGVERFKEEGRDARGGRLLTDAAQDVRYALRGIRRRPGFTAAVVATLAVGIGATTAVWSVVDASLLRPLSYPSPDRLARIQVSWEGEPNAALSPAEFLDFRGDAEGTFTALGAYAGGAATVGSAGEGAAERVDAAFVSAELFDALATAPLVGRPFTAEEELAGENAVVLSEGYWRQRLGGDPAAVGSTLTVSGDPFTVVGVMPSSFRLPENMIEGTRPALYMPLGLDPATAYERGSHFIQAAGRLAPGVTMEQAAEAVEATVASFTAAFPEDYEPEDRYQATAVPLREAVVGDVRPALRAALGAVLLVLLVGAANVAALLMARGEARRGELALRTTLGARRARLVLQLVVETLVLGALGGVLGVMLAWVGVEALVGLRPPGIPRLEDVAVDGRVLAFAAGLSALCGLGFGLIPALRVAPGATAQAIRQSSTRSVGGGSRRLRRALVVGEIAFALALLAGAGVLGRSLSELLAVDPGIRIERVVGAEFGVPSSRYPEPADVRGLVERAVERVRALPEVEAAGAVTNLPLAEPIGDLGVLIPGKEIPGDGRLPVDWQVVTPGYDRAVGLELVAGRWVEARDRADGLGAVVINRRFAETWWPDGDAVGATVQLSAETQPGEARVVGVVEDVRHEGPGTPANLQIYIPHTQFRFWYGGGPARGMALVARLRPGATGGGINRVFGELDPEIGLGPILTLEEAYRDVLSRPRMLTALVGSFAAIALLLAAIGVYGVMSYSVGRRRREFGIRAALGARSSRIATGILGEGLALAGAGIALGLGAAFLLTGTLRSLVFGVSPSDPAVLAGGAVVLLVVTAVASLGPVRRAVRTAPAESLRAE